MGEFVLLVLLLAWSVRYTMKPWELVEHAKHGDGPEVRFVGNVLGWVIALFLGVVLAFAFVALSGCGGQGMSLDAEGLTVGPSRSVRDRVALAESGAAIEQGAKDAEAEREALGRVGLALAVAVAVAGVGYGLKAASPLVREAVGGLEAALEVRRGRRLEVSLEVSPGGVYVGHLLAEGFSSEELAGVLAGAPALDAPRVLALQERAGGRGLLALQERGLLAEALAEVSPAEASEGIPAGIPEALAEVLPSEASAAK